MPALTAARSQHRRITLGLEHAARLVDCEQDPAFLENLTHGGQPEARATRGNPEPGARVRIVQPSDSLQRLRIAIRGYDRAAGKNMEATQEPGTRGATKEKYLETRSAVAKQEYGASQPDPLFRLGVAQ